MKFNKFYRISFYLFSFCGVCALLIFTPSQLFNQKSNNKDSIEYSMESNQNIIQLLKHNYSRSLVYKAKLKYLENDNLTNAENLLDQMTLDLLNSHQNKVKISKNMLLENMNTYNIIFNNNLSYKKDLIISNADFVQVLIKSIFKEDCMNEIIKNNTAINFLNLYIKLFENYFFDLNCNNNKLYKLNSEKVKTLNNNKVKEIAFESYLDSLFLINQFKLKQNSNKDTTDNVILKLNKVFEQILYSNPENYRDFLKAIYNNELYLKEICENLISYCKLNDEKENWKRAIECLTNIVKLSTYLDTNEKESIKVCLNFMIKFNLVSNVMINFGTLNEHYLQKLNFIVSINEASYILNLHSNLNYDSKETLRLIKLYLEEFPIRLELKNQLKLLIKNILV